MTATAKWAALGMKSTSIVTFYRYIPPRPVADIDTELKPLGSQIGALLSEVVV